MGAPGFSRGEIVDTPLARWLLELAAEHNWVSQHQAALYLGVKQPALNKWLRARFMPSPYYQRILSAKTGRPLAFVDDLVERSRAGSALPTDAAARGVVREHSPAYVALTDAFAEKVARWVVRLQHDDYAARTHPRRRPPEETDPAAG